MKSTSENRSVSTVHQSRCSVFQPTRRPTSVQAREVETPWGRTVVTGTLGQAHQDLLDAAFLVAEKKVEGPDSRIYLKIDPYRLRTTVGGVPYKNIIKLFAEMRNAEVRLIVQARGIEIIGGILDEVAVSSNIIDRPPSRSGVFEKGKRHYWRIIVSRSWSDFMNSDIPTDYEGRLGEILELRNGISQALARLMLTQHVNFRIGIDKALQTLGACGRRRDRIRELEMDCHSLSVIGIIVDFKKGIVGRRKLFPGTRESIPGTRESIPGNSLML